MLNKIKEVCSTLGSPIPISWLTKVTSQKILLPFYHSVSDKRLAHIGNLYNLRDVKTFKNDLDYFCRHFNPVTLEELNEIITQKKSLNKPVFHLTFDDGLSEFYSIIAPILKEQGVPATVFVNTAFIDNRDLFYRYKASLIIEKIKKASTSDERNTIARYANLPSNETFIISDYILSVRYSEIEILENIAKKIGLSFEQYLKDEKPYLTSAEIKELKEYGFTFGAHSHSHPYFKNINFELQKEEISKCFNILSNKHQIKEKYFSFPFSDEGVKAELFNWLYNTENCKLSFGISGLKKDINPYHLHRIPIEKSSKQAKDLIKEEYINYILKKHNKKQSNE